MNDPIQRGQELMLFGHYEEAQSHFLQLIHEDPCNDQALYHLGLCHLAFDNLTEAEDCLRQCLEVNPRNVDALVDLGEIELANGDPEQAMLSFGMAIALEEENPRGYVSMARVQDFLGLYEDAVENFQKAMVLADPGDAPSYDLALAYAKVGKFLRADVLLEGLLTETLRKGAQNFAYDGFEVSREDLTEFIRELQKDRERVQNDFLAQKLYPIDTARFMYQGVVLAREFSTEEAQRLVSEIRVLRWMGMDVQGRKLSYKLQLMDGHFAGHQLTCIEYAFVKHFSLNEDIDLKLADAYEEALSLTTL